MHVFKPNHWFLLFLIFLVTSPVVHATYPDITSGTWVGSVSGTDSSCTPGTLDGPFTDQVSVIFSGQSGSSFNVSLTSTESDGSVTTMTGTGIFTSQTSLNFTVADPPGPDVDTVNIAATLVNNTITFTFTGANVGGDGCIFNGSGSIQLTSATVIAPAVTPGSTVTDAALFNTQIQGTIFGVSSHVSAALSGLFFGGPFVLGDNQFKIKGATGLNAGDDVAIPYGVWGSYSYTAYENDLSSTAFDGASHGFLGGIDFGFWENTILGIAFGYDKGDIDTTFNRGNQETDTYTIAPYFGALLTDSLSVDFTVGYSKVEYDQFRILTTGTTRITSSPNSDRMFGAFNLNGITFYDNWIIGTRVGASYASSTLDSFTESDGTVVANSRTKVGTLSLAGDVAYSFKNYEPFVSLSYQNDFALREISVTTGPQPSNDNDDILMMTGVRYFNKNGITGNIEYSKRFLRDDFNEDRISLTIRADF